MIIVIHAISRVLLEGWYIYTKIVFKLQLLGKFSIKGGTCFWIFSESDSANNRTFNAHKIWFLLFFFIMLISIKMRREKTFLGVRLRLSWLIGKSIRNSALLISCPQHHPTQYSICGRWWDTKFPGKIWRAWNLRLVSQYLVNDLSGWESLLVPRRR